jgi:hypothetical protein
MYYDSSDEKDFFYYATTVIRRSRQYTRIIKTNTKEEKRTRKQ